MRRRWHTGLGLVGVLGCDAGHAAAMPQTTAQPPAPDETARDIVVRGHRVLNSAISDIQPVAVLGGDALKALGATTTRDLVDRLKGISSSAAGGEPAILLNGRRVSGIEELYSLPFEAIERTEILSAQDAARFGFPPTVRVMNFITKKHFRTLAFQDVGGTTTGGGGANNYAEVNATRIDGDRRASLTASDLHQSRILQSQRAIVPDPTVPFAVQGNVAGAGGGSIDPALDALAGHAVTIAAVPADAAARGRLASYAAAPPAVTDIGPYRTLQPTLDRVRLEGNFAAPLGKAEASLNLSVQQDRTSGLNGLAAGGLAVPAGSGGLPFSMPVTLYRYFPDAVLTQHGELTALHGGLTVQGGAGRWSWSITSRYDHALNRIASDTGVPLDALQASIGAGGNPLRPLEASTLHQRLTQRSRTRTDTIGATGVANGPLVRLPAGEALVTLTGDFARSASTVSSFGDGVPADRPVARSVVSESASVDVPIAAADQGVLSFAGQFGVNALVGVSAVSRYGRLSNTNIGFHWTPARPIQVTGSVNRTRTAPAINHLVDPLLIVPNVPVFDYVTGASVQVTTLNGGNPALAPESRRISTLGIALHPFEKREIRLTAELVDTRIDGQAASLANVTAPFQAAFPGLFTRDAAGALISVDLRPVNLGREDERKAHISLAVQAPLGHAPPPPPPPAPGKPPPPPPKPRPTLYAFVSGNYRFHDRLSLRADLPALDLLDGASLTGTGGRPRWDIDGTIGGSYGPVNIGLYNQLQGPTRVRSDLSTADLRFSGRTWLFYYTDVDMGAIIKRPWSKRLTVGLVVENLLDNRIAVRDRNGATPNRFQGAYLDPAGRTIRFNLRKSF